MKLPPVLAMTAGLLTGQIAIMPHNPATGPSATGKKEVAAAVPLLGFMPGPGPADVYPILGMVNKAHLGGRLTPPPNTSRIYLPPRQLYALIERNVDAPMALWDLGHSTAETTLLGIMSHPDLVAFSPRGEAGVLFSADQNRLQIIADLPAQSLLVREMPTGSRGPLSALAVTDDGALVVAEFADRVPLFSFLGGPWQLVSTEYRPQAWSFVPRTHDLVISDPAEKAIVLLPKVNRSPIPARVLTAAASADRLAVTKGGDHLLANSSTDGTMLNIDLSSGTISRLLPATEVTSVTLVRDGQTFLLSVFPHLSLLKLAPSPEVSLTSQLAH